MPVAVRIIRGVVDIPDRRALTEAHRLQPYSFGARSFAHGYSRRYRVGEMLTFSADEAERLAKAGIVEVLPAS